MDPIPLFVLATPGNYWGYTWNQFKLGLRPVVRLKYGVAIVEKDDGSEYELYKQEASSSNPYSDFSSTGTVTNYGTYGGISTWYPYGTDGKNYYIIAGEYYNPDNGLPDGLSKTNNSSFKYGIYQSSDTGTAPQLMSNRFWREFNWGTTEQTNTRFCEKLLNTSNWTSLLNNTYADEAIGAPTLEMLTKISGARGVGPAAYSSKTFGYDTSSSGKVGTTEKSLNLGTISGKASNCWIASPNSLGPDMGCYVRGSDGALTEYLGVGTSDTTCGIRPVIRLKAGLEIVARGSDYIIQ